MASETIMSDRINVRVRFFAALKTATGESERKLDIPAGTTVKELTERLGDIYPSLPGASGAVYAAVNRAYVGENTELADGDEVALFPPVSGGVGETVKLFEITTEPLSLDEVASRVSEASRGAITLFSGVVRGKTGELITDHLEYEAYAEMAEEMLAGIGAQVMAQWPQVAAVSIVHRVGRLEIGETSVVIAVAAAHRAGTFDACSYAIERLKSVVPIWKKEVGSDGQWWVEGPTQSNEVAPVISSDV
ncbi:MAG: MoaD family protein [Chloroflexota bacterium]|nr:MoaD family protein [Chloroflexota bacterium]